jgi:hypothetical protein
VKRNEKGKNVGRQEEYEDFLYINQHKTEIVYEETSSERKIMPYHVE